MRIHSINGGIGKGIYWTDNKLTDCTIKLDSEIKTYAEYRDKYHTFKRIHDYEEKVTISKGRITGYEYSFVTSKGKSVKISILFGIGYTCYIDSILVTTVKYKPNSVQAIDYVYEPKLDSKSRIVSLLGYSGKLKYANRGEHILSNEFIHRNGKLGFKMSRGKKHLKILSPKGKVIAEIHSSVGLSPLFKRDDILSRWNGSNSEISFDKDRLIQDRVVPNTGNPNKIYSFKLWDNKGKLTDKGQYENSQRHGEWLLDGVKTYYLSGVPVSEKLYTTPPEQLNGVDVLSIENNQLRASMLKKIGTEKFLKDNKATLIHQDGDMQLFSISNPNYDPKKIYNSWDNPQDPTINLLKVTCPSTGTYYTLRVHPEAKTCEEARQSTFRVRNFNNREEHMVFDKET